MDDKKVLLIEIPEREYNDIINHNGFSVSRVVKYIEHGKLVDNDDLISREMVLNTIALYSVNGKVDAKELSELIKKAEGTGNAT